MKEIQCTQVDDGAFFAGEIFMNAFQHEIPDWGYHLVCFYRKSPLHYIPLTYVNFSQVDNVILVGGAATNGSAFRQVEPAHAQQIREIGGSYLQLLKFGFDRFADRCDGYFGYTGDKRALEVDLKAGFEHTQHEYLIAHFHKPLDPEFRESLIEKVHRLGAF